MTILKGFYKAERENNQECEHGIEELPAIKICEGFNKTQVLDLNTIDFEQCYGIVKQKTEQLYGGQVQNSKEISKYKEAIRKQLEKQIDELNVCPDEYEERNHDEDKLSFHEAYLESMYSSGVPMNKCEQKALLLVRGAV